MAFDPSTIQPEKKKFDPSTARSDVPAPVSTAEKPKEEKKKTFREKTGDIAEAGGYGVAAGFFAPELMTGAGLAAAAIILAPKIFK